MPTLPDQTETYLLEKSEFAGIGCLYQGVGVVAPFVGWVVAGYVGAALGVIVFLALYAVGDKKAKILVCGNCHNRIASADVRMCPVCRIRFEEAD